MDTKLIKRASAEGIKTSSVLEEIVKLVKEHQDASTGTWECKDLVTEEEIIEVLTFERHAGGYMYPGWYSKPSTFNGLRFSKGEDSPADVEGAKEWIRNSKDGDEVTSITDFGPGSKEEKYYRKEGGKWYETGGYSETLYRVPFDRPIWLAHDFKDEVARRLECEASSTFVEIYDFISEGNMVGNVIYFP